MNWNAEYNTLQNLILHRHRSSVILYASACQPFFGFVHPCNRLLHFHSPSYCQCMADVKIFIAQWTGDFESVWNKYVTFHSTHSTLTVHCETNVLALLFYESLSTTCFLPCSKFTAIFKHAGFIRELTSKNVLFSLHQHMCYFRR